VDADAHRKPAAALRLDAAKVKKIAFPVPLATRSLPKIGSDLEALPLTLCAHRASFGSERGPVLRHLQCGLVGGVLDCVARSAPGTRLPVFAVEEVEEETIRVSRTSGIAEEERTGRDRLFRPADAGISGSGARAGTRSVIAPCATDVPTRFEDELPDPVPGEDDSRLIDPITFHRRCRFQRRRELELSRHEGSAAGKPVPCWYSTPTKPANPKLAPDDAWCLIPNRPAAPARAASSEARSASSPTRPSPPRSRGRSAADAERSRSREHPADRTGED